MSELAKQILKDNGLLPPTPPGEGNPAGAEAAKGAKPGAEGAGKPDPETPVVVKPKEGEGGEGAGGGATGAGTPGNANNSTDQEPVIELKTDAPKPGAKPEPAATEPKQQPAKPAANDPQALLEALKAHGIDVKSLDELKPRPPALTPEELEVQRQEEASNAIRFGLEHKLFSAQDLEAYTKEKERPVRDRAMDVFAAALRKDDAAITDEEIEEQFSDFFGEALPEDNKRRQKMEREMERMAEVALRAKYEGIVKSTDAYRTATQVEAEVRQYRAAVETTFAEFPAQMEFEIEGRKYHYKPNNDTLGAIKDQFLSGDTFAVFGEKTPTREELTAAVTNSLLQRDHKRMIEVIAKAHSDQILLEDKAGRQGVIPNRGAGGNQQGDGGGAYQGYAKDIINQNNKNS